ncbi:MAG: hypothetical protein ACI4M5_02915 [Christensenellales bacterium]
MVNYWQALGYLKNMGYTEFETFSGETKTYDELRSHPIVTNAKQGYTPTKSGELRTKEGFRLLKGIR